MKKKVEKEGGKKQEMITVEVKKENIEKHERGMRVSIISYGEIRFDIRVLWITSTFPERIMLSIQGLTIIP
jgi:hypothetical protein